MPSITASTSDMLMMAGTTVPNVTHTRTDDGLSSNQSGRTPPPLYGTKRIGQAAARPDSRMLGGHVSSMAAALGGMVLMPSRCGCHVVIELGDDHVWPPRLNRRDD